MKKILLLLFIVACNDSPEKKADTTVVPDSSGTAIDPTAAGVKADDYYEGQTFEEIRDDFEKMYYSRLNIDTSLLFGEDTVRFQFEYHCKMDSAVTVPKNYVGMYGLENYVTHNFTSSVSIIKDQQTILKREINKSDFDLTVNDLKEWAVLMYPQLHYGADSIAISYSISIPLTDVGISGAAIIRPDNSVSFVLGD